MTEQESEKFKDLPGVVFVLPDSYIDPQNKEYGGDKYENGVITHRPPPVHHSRSRPPRGNPRFGQQNFQRNTQYGQQPPVQGGGGSYGPPQGYGTPGQGTQTPPPFQGGYNQGPGSPPPPYQAGYNQGQGSPMPPHQGTQGSYGQGGPGNYSQGPQGGTRNYSPQGNGNYGPPPGAGNPGYGHGYSGAGQEQNQRNPAGDWNNNNPASQPGSDQFPQGRRY